MFENCWSWPPVKVSRFRPFLSYMESPWASRHISKCEGPRWAHFLLYRRVLRAIFDGRFAAFRCYVQNCWSWGWVTLLLACCRTQLPCWLLNLGSVPKRRLPMASRHGGGGGLAQLLGLTLALAAVQPVTGCEVIFLHAAGPPFYVQEFSIRHRSIASEAVCMEIHN